VIYWKSYGFQGKSLGFLDVSKRLLIIGGTGFIGKSLAREALLLGFSVVVLSLRCPSKKEKIQCVSYLQADINNFIDLQNNLVAADFEYVVNLSGYVDHAGFFTGGKAIIDTHFIGLQNITQILNWKKIERFVQVGSSDEYGGNEAPQHENMREMPISPYSLAKVANTHFLQMLHRTDNFQVVILRLFLVYGPGQGCGRFLPQIVEGCFSEKEFKTSLGEQVRDFCYIDDITDGILKALKCDNVNGEIINLASGNPISIRTVIEKVQTYIGKGSPKFGKIAYRTGENMSLYADISKAELLLGWRPKTAIESGIKKIVDHYRLHNLK